MSECRTVLVVDDEKGVLAAFRAFLSGPGSRGMAAGPMPSAFVGIDGIRVLLAASGEEAVAMAAAERSAGERIACGFLDMKMAGGIDGLETVQRLRRLDPAFLCTVVTACEDELVDRVAEYFAPDHQDEWDYLSKPFTRWEVVQKCRQMVQSWNRREREAAHLERNVRLCVQLEEARRDLEARVSDRTRALAEANLRLEARNGEISAVLEALSRAQAQLAHADKMASIGQLAAGVAHEINNPVGYVHANLGTLSRWMGRLTRYHEVVERDVPAMVAAGADGAAITRALEAMRRELGVDVILGDLPALVSESREGTLRIKDIVSALRTFSHPGRGVPMPTDVNDGLRSTLALVASDFRRRARVETDLGEVPSVMGSSSELNQVWLNLLINAAQATEGRDGSGTIRVRTRVEGGRVEVQVEDDGCGMAPDVLARVFEPFFTTKDVGQGTGLGLPVAWNIVRKHGGEILVDSEPGKGTTFTVRLPAAASAEPAAREAPAGLGAAT